MPLALEGVRILDLSRVPTGSFCTMVLGDLGAEVLKVEAPPGAGERGAGMGLPVKGRGSKRELAFNALDRNKKSIAINLKTDQGRGVFLKLAERHDVIMECFRPGVTKRLGIDYTSVRTVNPRIVYASLTGYGQSGPKAGDPGHDINYIAAAGVLGLIGEKGRKPAIPLNLIGDYAGGSLFAVIGIMAALRARESTGRGQQVDIAMADGALSLLMASPVAAQCLADGPEPSRGETIFSGEYPFYGIYRTGDNRYLSVGCAEPWFWENLCRAIGKEEFIQYHSLFRQPLRGKEGRKNREIKAELQKVFLTRTGEEWMKALRGKDIPAAIVRPVREVFEDSQVLHRKMVLTIPFALADGGARQVGMPVNLGETPGSVRKLAPALGEDTEETLKDLGYSPEERQKLRQCGAVL